MKRVLLGSLVVIAALGGFIGGFGYGRWYGKAPAHGGEAKKEKKIAYWVDPMHPQYKSDRPGIAPDCGMDLVPVYDDGTQGGGAGSLPPGMVQVSADKQQWIGVTTEVVEITPIEEVVQAVGSVAADESRIVPVTSRTEGWVDKVFVDTTGALVRKGEPMFTLYSPEMAASQQEYLLAIKAKETLEHSSVPGLTRSNESLVAAARQRLLHWGLAADSIQQLEKTGEPSPTITIYAPASGYVTERKAFPNVKVSPDMELYTLTDQSHVWIVADVFESDAASIRLGQPATVTIAALPNRKIRATVTNILPRIDAETRTLKVRLGADNPTGFLKPDLFVNVEFALPRAPKLTVPADAVLDSGQRQIVFVDKGSGLFERRQVTVGERFDDKVEIAAGLKEGERIVTSGVFLLDSESQLKSPDSGAGSHHD